MPTILLAWREESRFGKGLYAGGNRPLDGMLMSLKDGSLGIVILLVLLLQLLREIDFG